LLTYSSLTAGIYVPRVRRLLLTLSMLAGVLVQAGGASTESSHERLTFNEVGLRGSPKVLSRHEIRPTTFSLAPDHRHFAFVPYLPFDGRSPELWVADVRGPGERKILHSPGYVGSAAWAPDGRSIAVSQYFNGTDGIWLVDPDGSNLRRIGRYGSRPSWSPDSRRLLYEHREGPNFPQSLLAVLDVDTGSTRELGDGQKARWSPDGQMIAYERVLGCECPPEIRVLSIATGASRRLARGYTPTWSPDGRRIAFIRAPGVVPISLWTVPTGGGKPRRLASNLAFGWGGWVWSPTGRLIAFVRHSRTGSTLNVVATSGMGRPRRLVSSRGLIMSLAWRGKRMLYRVIW
jgi:Tol biopolymer transport system component